MEREQTAVEWLIEVFDLEMFDTFHLDKINQAKQMEKEQIKKAFDKGLITENVYHGYDDKKAEKYYNETYGNEKHD